jgi:anaerobic glycerol-3-phosphate dehydrogenase C subunit
MVPIGQQHERIQDDLRGLVAGEVRCDDFFRQLHASDASIYEICPLAVVRPSCAADVSACIRYARDHNLSVHARGAGTASAGESLGPGISVDFSKYLRHVIRIDAEKVRVQAGMVLERLNTQLRPLDRIFGPDPSKTAVTTMGSSIALDAVGSRWLKYGSVRNYVISLQAVLSDGEILELGREPLSDGASVSTIPRKRDLVNQLAAIFKENADLIRLHRLQSPISRCGYNLDGVLGDDYIDIARLLTGSEGTLALITEASVATQPLPGPRGVTLLLFDSLDKAARAVREILPWKPNACELMDRRHLSLAREAEVRFDLLIPADTEALLMIEQEADDLVELNDQMHQMAAYLTQTKRMAYAVRQAFEPDELKLFWHLIDRVQPSLFRLKGPARTVPVADDIAVPPEILPDFIPRVQNVLKRQQITASLFAHAGQGELHIRPFLDLANAEDVQRMRRLAEELYKEVIDVGGSITGEHGYGLSRTSFLKQQAGPLYEVLRAIKQVFDPANTFNPGKIVGDDPDLMIHNLQPVIKTQAASPPADADTPIDQLSMRNLAELQMDWDPAKVVDTVIDCNRCGVCRTQSPEARMCPIFRIAPSEEASPRAKANLLRGILSNAMELHKLPNEEFKRIADLCVHCHMCRLECPAGVDIPRLMRESKGAYVAANGLTFAERAIIHLDILGALGGMVSPVTNWALSNRQMRWLLEKTLGIAQGRKLPQVTSRNFIRRAQRRRLARPIRRSAQKVLYFVDVYANYFDPQLADSLVSVMEHNGVAVYVPANQKPAGMPSIACGALDHARYLAEHNVTMLAEAVRQGYHVVATEPAAALCLTREYPQMIDDDDSRLLAANSSEACTYLWRMHTQGKLQLDLKPINITLGYHTPCHMKALQVGTPGEHLLGLIPGVRIEHIEKGCSGMAGTFGLFSKNYRSSLRAGLRLINQLRSPALQAGVTECSTCKIQMEQGTDKPTIHPIKLLALSYGLMPDVARLLNTKGEELVVT